MIALPILTDRVDSLPALPAADIDRGTAFACQDKAPATRTAYRGDFTRFRLWCMARNVSAPPASPETVAGYLAAEAEAGLAASTIGRRCAAIRHAHKLAGHEPPTNNEAVKATLRGIRRTIGAAPKRKAPTVAEITQEMARAAPADIKGLRDRALLLLGFGGAFRRSELVALDVADIEETEDGLRVTIRRSKTDQEGQARRSLSSAAARAARSRRYVCGLMRPRSPRARSSGRSAWAQGPRPPTHREIRLRTGEGLRQRGWPRRHVVRGTLAAIGLPHFGGPPRSLGVQDARRI
jgi:integrase